MPKPSKSQIERIRQRLLGSANESLDIACEDEGLCPDDVAELLEIELCEQCGWWCETSELVSEDGNDTGKCEDCRSE